MELELTATIFRPLEKMSAAMRSSRLVLPRRQVEIQEWTEKHLQATVTPYHRMEEMEDPHQVREAVVEDMEAAQAAEVKGRMILGQKTRMSDQR